jgi:hypothetical protein
MQAVILLVWSAIEGAVFAVTLRPTISELVEGLFGFEVNPMALVLVIWIFATMLIAGSFVSLHALTDAIRAKHVSQIMSLIMVQVTIAFMQVYLMYRVLIDAMAPWLAQGGVTLGVEGTLGLASFAWIGVRGMTWYLFGRSGAPALVVLLNRGAATP